MIPDTASESVLDSLLARFAAGPGVYQADGWSAGVALADIARAAADSIAPVRRAGASLVAIRLPPGGRQIAVVLAALEQHMAVLLVPTSDASGAVLRRVRPDAVIGGPVPDGYAAVPGGGDVSLAYRPGRDVRSDGWAYAISTSGSTGTPRVCVVGRASLAQHVTRIRAAFDLSPDDVVLQASPPGFDVWLEEVLPAVEARARLVCLPQGLLLGAAEFTEVLRTTGASVVNLPAGYWSLWSRWLDSAPSAALPPALRLVVVGSEPVPARTARSWVEAGRPRLISAYGLSEATVTSLIHDVTVDGVDPDAALVPLGRPLPGSGYDLRRGPEPGPAHLVLTGTDLQLGYLTDAATRVLGDRPAELHTGDLVENSPRGPLFVGRSDDLVKVRGVRLSPLEAEAALSDAPGVIEGVVVPAGPVEAVRLVAVVVTALGHGEDETVVREIAQHLSDLLPPSRRPDRIFVRPALPHLPNGKIDRQAVRSALQAESASTAAPLRTDPEPGDLVGVLTAAFSTVLGTTLTPDSDVFAHGVNSLLAVAALTEAERTAGVQVPLREVFLGRTPRRIAGSASARGGRSRLPAVASRTGSDGDEAPLTVQQSGVWFHQLIEPGSSAYHCQSRLDLEGPVDPARLERAFTAVVAAHGVYRTAFPARRGVGRQRMLRAAPFTLETANAAPETWLALEERFIDRPFNLERPPLLRALLLRDGSDQRATLVIVEHHLVHDGFGFALLLRDLMRVYESGADLPTPAPDYVDYARWQAEQLAGEPGRELVAHFLPIIEAVPDLARLCRTRPASGPPGGGTGVVRRLVPQDAVDRSRALAATGGPTLFAQFAAAFHLALARACDQDDFCVGIAAANRRVPGTEHILGMFVTTLPLRLRARPGEPYHDYVGRSADAILDALEHQELPFATLARAAGVIGSMHNPLFQAVLGFDDGPVPAVRLGSTRGTVRELLNGSPKLPLTVIVVPQREQRAGTGQDGDAAVDVIWEYDRALLDEAEVRALVDGFHALLGAITQEPDAPVDSLALPLTGAWLQGLPRT